MRLTDKIEKVLAQYEEARNCDMTLTYLVWYEYHQDRLKYVDNEWYVKLSDLKELPREDHVKRHRARLQNEEGKYLPTDPTVIKKRRLHESKWRKELGYDL